MPRSLSEHLLRQVPLLRTDQDLGSAARAIVATGLPALPVVDEDERYAGIFGERELITAAFPGYLRELHSAAFVSHAAEEGIELRDCAHEPVADHMNTEHVDVGSDVSDARVAEIFLHHRVLIVPVVDDGRVRGVITRADFFKAVADRLRGGDPGS